MLFFRDQLRSGFLNQHRGFTPDDDTRMDDDEVALGNNEDAVESLTLLYCLWMFLKLLINWIRQLINVLTLLLSRINSLRPLGLKHH